MYICFSIHKVSIFHDPALSYYKRALRVLVMDKVNACFLLRLSSYIFLRKINKHFLMCIWSLAYIAKPQDILCPSVGCSDISINHTTDAVQSESLAVFLIFWMG